jgi:hypothetical protein
MANVGPLRNFCIYGLGLNTDSAFGAPQRRKQRRVGARESGTGRVTESDVQAGSPAVGSPIWSRLAPITSEASSA